MPIAFVLVDTQVKKVESILEEIREIDSVKEAYSVAGTHDIIAKVHKDGFQDVAVDVTKRIHKIDGIKNTETLFAFK